jgi:hypothetical protein
VAQPFFAKKYYITFTGNESSPKFWTTLVLFKKLPEEDDRQIGENSPNVVTLIALTGHGQFFTDWLLVIFLDSTMNLRKKLIGTIRSPVFTGAEVCPACKVAGSNPRVPWFTFQ